jgi:2-oxoglutarate dehydrogenase E2 component (dihydrolipoamide succinyltransferase)
MGIEIKVPQLGESVSEATVARWLKKPGEAIAADEAVVELETDKVTLEVNASQAGNLAEIVAQEGETVSVGALLGTIGEDKGTAPASKPAQAASATPERVPQPAPQQPKIENTPINGNAARAPIEMSGPAARKMVEDKGLDPATIEATGKGGRITKADVLNAGSAPAPQPAKAPAAPRATDAREERVRMTRLRQRIAERLKEAQNTAAMLTTFNEVDMTEILKLRAEYKDAFEKKHKVKLGFMSFFTKAAVAALKEFPSVNAEIDGQDIVYKNYYDISVAVSTPTGLVVPVVRDCDTRSFAEIEKAIGDLGLRARDGKLTIDELTGGTFTITNGGVFGSMMSTPIINPPQSAILGIHKTMDRPVALKGQVVIRPMMYVALSYDHRIIDGREAVSFLVKVKDAIENPERLLFDL